MPPNNPMTEGEALAVDYSTLARDVARTLQKAGAPLTEDQILLLAGSLAVYVEAALTAAQQQGQAVAWLVEREGDPTFPRAFTCESDAVGWVRRVELHPFAKKRPLIYGDTAQQPVQEGGGDE